MNKSYTLALILQVVLEDETPAYRVSGREDWHLNETILEISTLKNKTFKMRDRCQIFLNFEFKDAKFYI